MNDMDAGLEGVRTPCYVVEERLLRKNLEVISDVASRAGVEIILAFKAFALWRTFPIFKEYIGGTTASSIFEARLAVEEFGGRAHTYSPAYTSETFDEIMCNSSHITFNSLSQYSLFYPRVDEYNRGVDAGKRISCGLRINPEYSEIDVDLYNPCAKGSRFGVSASDLPADLPVGIDGFHCHCHCESSSYALAHTLEYVEQKFGKYLSKLKWINLGGGHLMTRADYDVDHLVALLRDFRERHPGLRVILEPGSAFAWQTGTLVASVVDVVVSGGIKTAIVDVSFTCHMPDCLEMPYQPGIVGAESLPADAAEFAKDDENIYRIGGNSCLSGDYMGSWRFENPLGVGDRIVFEDMIHYTTVKTTMFNGIVHPDILMLCMDGTTKLLRRFCYEDYRDRMC